VRIVIEFDADGGATVTTEPHPQGEGMQALSAAGSVGPAEATDAGPPAEGTPLTGRAAAVLAVDAGPAPDAVGAADGEPA
jgi:hypothetical protein